MSELKEKYIQLCCDFYNEHANEDKIWFGRMFDGCHQEHNKRNSSMYRWQFPLMILKSQQAEINQHQLEIHALGEANLNQAMMLAKKQEEIDSLKAQLNNMETCCIEKKKRVDELQGALNEVKEWKSHPVGYEASFGSSGVRDFYKDLAGKALRGEHE